MSYAVNGAWLGEAFTIPKDQPVFPHALAKNAAVTASFDTVPTVDTGLDTLSFLSWQVYMRHCLAMDQLCCICGLCLSSSGLHAWGSCLSVAACCVQQNVHEGSRPVA